MSIQNPTIPTATQAKGIDAVIVDLQMHLSNDLDFLSNGMGRAYKKKKARTKSVVELLPLVYLGTANHNYFPATPDKTKKGQSIIIVGDGTILNQRAGFYGIMEYPISIIFSLNLKLIDATLLLTEDFTEHEMAKVRESLLRNLLGKYYKLEITNETRDFDEVYSEFDVAVGTTNEPLLPMTYFRFDCVVSMNEDCAGVVLDRCTAIKQNLTATDLNECILPTYDFTNLDVQANVTAQQQLDLQAWLCSSYYSMDYDGVNELLWADPIAAMQFQGADEFSCCAWIKIDSLDTCDIISYIGNGQGWTFRVRSDGKIQLSMERQPLVNNNWGFVASADDVLTAHLGTWVWVAATKPNTTSWAGAKVFINGIEVASSTLFVLTNTIDYTGSNPAIGGRFSGSGQESSDIKIFTSRVYDRQITPAEALAESGNLTPVAAVTSGLILDPNITTSIFTGTPYAFQVTDDSPTGAIFNGINLEQGDKNKDAP